MHNITWLFCTCQARCACEFCWVFSSYLILTGSSSSSSFLLLVPTDCHFVLVVFITFCVCGSIFSRENSVFIFYLVLIFYSFSVRFVLRIIMVFVYSWVLSSWGIYLIRRGVIFASEACASTPFYLCKMSYTFRKSKVVRQSIDAFGCYWWFSTGHILVQSAQISQINLGMKRLSRKLNDMVHGIVLKKYGPGTAV